ncbi:hypothetical protein DPMN_109359 [Dreissena polymorpha]|uniref:Uncharacterized protein n=1 Tax=Dreissena polymorpha TaxID=45954 RepID=A0A9D4KAK0_DREPO|nr:hypothetical protein DPMN_109359 [Dreissena polymorpha]
MLTGDRCPVPGEVSGPVNWSFPMNGPGKFCPVSSRGRDRCLAATGGIWSRSCGEKSRHTELFLR